MPHKRALYAAFVRLLAEETGQTLTENRHWRIDTMLRPVMVRYGFASLADLAEAIGQPNQRCLRQDVVDSLVNNETSFFRDARIFACLDENILEALHARKAADRSLRIWFAGCSTGQEAYSVAMMLAEQRQRWQDWEVELVASDVSATAVKRARDGLYSQFEIQRGLSVKRMIRWFDKVGEEWQALPALRDSIRFHCHDLRSGSPEQGRFDIIFCRNVMLYFDPGLRRQLFSQFAALTRDCGYLLLGAGETVIVLSDAFRSSIAFPGFHQVICPEARGAPCRRDIQRIAMAMPQ